jgi:hypothetical protein
MRARIWICALSSLALAGGCVDEDEDDEPVSTITSEVIINPTIGGPFAGYTTYRCTNQPGSFSYSPSCGGPITTAAQVTSYLNNAATNWGCPSAYFTQTVTPVTGGFTRQYGHASNTAACGVAYWNAATQAAYWLPNTERSCSTSSCGGGLNNTNRALHQKYQALGAAGSVLGMPISNPIPYNWANVTIQLFTRGFITYRAGDLAAYYAGGTDLDRRTLAASYLDTFGVTPSSAQPIYALVQDPKNTCITAGALDCAGPQDTGDYLKYWDAYWGMPGYTVLRAGWTYAYSVHGPIYTVWNNNQQPPIYNGHTPWSGSTLGFPIGPLQTVGTAGNGQDIQVQQFERGAIAWQPKTCDAVHACPAAGTQHCTTYGALSTNYRATIVKQGAPLTANDALAVCAPDSGQLAPLCDASQWTPYGDGLTGQFICDSPTAFPVGIRFHVELPNLFLDYMTEIPRELYPAWIEDGTVAEALAIYGVPEQSYAEPHEDVHGNIDYMQFPRGRVYAAGWTRGAFGVHGAIWNRYVELAMHPGVLGYPISRSTPRNTYPRYQYFERGLIIADGPTTTSWTSTMFGNCSDVCESDSHVVPAGRECWIGWELTECAAVGLAAGDADLDDIPDALEDALVERFKPTMTGDLYDANQRYGAWGTLGGPTAPVVVRFYTRAYGNAPGTSGRGFNCGQAGAADGTFFEDKRCIEIIYTTPYNWDTGGLNGHRGDAELVTVLVARRDPYSFHTQPLWGTSWAAAQADASQWKLVKSWASAHHQTGSWDSSAFDIEPIGVASAATSQIVHVALDKHANYWSNDACDDGANYTDDCDPSSNVDWEVAYANAGEVSAHRVAQYPGTVMPYPNADTYEPASQSGSTYDVWGGASFGSSTPLREQIAKGFMHWTTNCTEKQPADGSPGQLSCY